MKVCFYSPTPSPLDILSGKTTERGGAEKQIAHLMTALADSGHQVYLLYGGVTNQPYPTLVEGVHGRRLNLTTWKRPGAVVTLWQQLNQIQPDLIYTRLPDDFLWIVGLFARLRAKTKFVYALANDAHCNPWRAYAYHPWFHNTLYALGLSTAHVVLIQHEGQRRLVPSYMAGKLMRLPNLMQSLVERSRDYHAADFDAIWVAQVRPKKQLAVFLDVVERLPRLRFALVGGFNDSVDEATQTALKERIHALPNLTYLGLQKPSDAMRLLARSKVLLNTSSDEGFPNTMLEAWSLGVPVVSLTVDPGDVIQRNALGFVSGNLAQLCADVERLVHSFALNHKLGTNGMDYVQKNHSLEVVMAAFELLLNGRSV